MTLITIDAPHFNAGLIVDQGYIVDAAPILRWAIGKESRRGQSVPSAQAGGRGACLTACLPKMRSADLRKSDIIVIRRRPEEPWLILLAQGWQLAEAEACHLEDHHARYDVLLWRLEP